MLNGSPSTNPPAGGQKECRLITVQLTPNIGGLDVDVALKVAQQGSRYLLEHARTFLSESETGVTWKDNFLEALLLEVTANWNLVDLRIPAGKWNYFGGEPCKLTTNPYPDDIDTQSLLATIIKPVDTIAHALMDEMLANETVDGIVPVRLTISYFMSTFFCQIL